MDVTENETLVDNGKVGGTKRLMEHVDGTKKKMYQTDP
jgi:hypothetical protein